MGNFMFLFICLFSLQHDYAGTLREINRCRLPLRKKQTIDNKDIVSNDEISDQQRTVSFSNLQVCALFYLKFIQKKKREKKEGERERERDECRKRRERMGYIVYIACHKLN